MSFEDQLRGEFGQAGQELQLDDGSIGAVKRRARLRTRRVRVASGAALVSISSKFIIMFMQLHSTIIKAQWKPYAVEYVY